MDEVDPGWGESVWDAPAGTGWQDEINGAIEEASMPPLDPSVPDPIGPEYSEGSGEAGQPSSLESATSLWDYLQEAIEQASVIPMGEADMAQPSVLPDDDPLGHCTPGPELPPGSDVILLDLLPTSTMSIDESGRIQIEPDPVGMAERGYAGREVAEHLVSWLNETGAAPSAIAHAISSGAARLEMLMRQYDDILMEAGYDRSNPSVQQCDDEIHALHDSIEHAKEVLADLRG